MKKYLLYIECALNTFENRFTGTTSFESFYEIKSRDLLISIIKKESFSIEVEFMDSRSQIRADFADVAHLIQVRMAVFGDKRHRLPELTNKVFLKMTQQGQVEYHLPKFSSLSVKEIGPFPIKKKVGNLAYELDHSIHRFFAS